MIFFHHFPQFIRQCFQNPAGLPACAVIIGSKKTTNPPSSNNLYFCRKRNRMSDRSLYFSRNKFTFGVCANSVMLCVFAPLRENYHAKMLRRKARNNTNAPFLAVRSIYILVGLTVCLSSCKAQSVAVDKQPAAVATESLEYAEAIRQALYFQIRADSLRRATEAQVAALADAPESQKAGMRIAIRDIDAQATATQKKADEWFARGGRFEQSITPAAADNQSEPTAPEESKPAGKVEVKDAPKKTDVKDASTGEFAILARSPYSADNPIPVDAVLPDGTAYKIQLGAFGKPLQPNTFKGLTPISAEKLPGGVTKYFVGMFRKFSDADDALRKVHEYGYKDAYIVAFYNKKVISPERAKQLENK